MSIHILSGSHFEVVYRSKNWPLIFLLEINPVRLFWRRKKIVEGSSDHTATETSSATKMKSVSNKINDNSLIRILIIHDMLWIRNKNVQSLNMAVFNLYNSNLDWKKNIFTTTRYLHDSSIWIYTCKISTYIYDACLYLLLDVFIVYILWDI